MTQSESFTPFITFLKGQTCVKCMLYSPHRNEQEFNEETVINHKFYNLSKASKYHFNQYCDQRWHPSITWRIFILDLNLDLLCKQHVCPRVSVYLVVKGRGRHSPTPLLLTASSQGKQATIPTPDLLKGFPGIDGRWGRGFA